MSGNDGRGFDMNAPYFFFDGYGYAVSLPYPQAEKSPYDRDEMIKAMINDMDSYGNDDIADAMDEYEESQELDEE